MIPTLYDKTGTKKLGELHDILDGSFVEEEGNGLFDYEFEYPNDYPLADLLVNENMVEVKPNDEQDPQKFRIYDVKKLMDNIITVFARHESFDLANDHVESINLLNASCEYTLNTLFRNSHYSQDYRGYSDIVNAQDYAIDNVNILAAIAGKKGSIIDTYGTGPQILRNHKEIHVLNKRGHDNGVTIEYGKNLTGFELSVDLTDLETRCGGFAKYRPEGANEDIIVKSDWIDSPFIGNFVHPYISREGRRDYSDKFKDGAIPTKETLNKLCLDEFKINKRDIPKSNYKIEFIPLSKCVGYEEVQDKISLCDTVGIKDYRFNVDTKAKVIKYKYDPVKERYISMELGKPRTTLGDVIGGSNNGSLTEDEVKDIVTSTPSENFPNTLPKTPVLTGKVYGFDGIGLSWTFENKAYYSYELYASKTKDFAPNAFDLIHKGQTSSHSFDAKPGETWYFKVCAINSHGNRTIFSNQVEVTTRKVDDFDEYFSSLAVGNLVTNIFSADYMEANIIKGNWIDMRQLTLTDGNGVRRVDIDDFGKFYIKPSVFILETSDTNVPTKKEVSDAVGVANSYTDTQMQIVAGQIREKVSQTDYDANNKVISEQFIEVNKTAQGISQEVSKKVGNDEIISKINQSAEKIKIESNNIELAGATTIGSNGNKVYIDDYAYRAIVNSIQAMYWGGWHENDKFIPVFMMGANGFDSTSSTGSGSYFAMKNFGYMQHVGFRSKITGQWNVIELHENGHMRFVPINSAIFEKPTVFNKLVTIYDKLDIRDPNDYNQLKVRLSNLGIATNEIANLDGGIVNFNGSLRCMYSTNSMGTENGRWRKGYYVSAPDISSDITLKENIVYTDSFSYVPYSSRLNTVSLFALPEQEYLTYQDMYDFFKNDYRNANYNYIGDKEHVLGIIAQDLISTKVGKTVVKENEDGKLSYSLENRLSVAEGALKEAISKLEIALKRIEILESENQNSEVGV